VESVPKEVRSIGKFDPIHQVFKFLTLRSLTFRNVTPERLQCERFAVLNYVQNSGIACLSSFHVIL